MPPELHIINELHWKLHLMSSGSGAQYLLSFIYGERIWGKITKLGISFILDLPDSCRVAVIVCLQYFYLSYTSKILAVNKNIWFLNCVETRSFFLFNCISRNIWQPNQPKSAEQSWNSSLSGFQLHAKLKIFKPLPIDSFRK